MTVGAKNRQVRKKSKNRLLLKIETYPKRGKPRNIVDLNRSELPSLSVISVAEHLKPQEPNEDEITRKVQGSNPAGDEEKKTAGRHPELMTLGGPASRRVSGSIGPKHLHDGSSSSEDLPAVRSPAASFLYLRHMGSPLTAGKTADSLERQADIWKDR